MPDGVLINGKGPYRYNDTLVPDGIDHETINVEPGKYALFLPKINFHINFIYIPNYCPLLKSIGTTE